MRKRIEISGELDVTGPRGSLQVRGAGDRLTVHATELSALLGLRSLAPRTLGKLDALPEEMTPPIDIYVGKRRVMRVDLRVNSWLGKMFAGHGSVAIMPGNLVLAMLGGNGKR